MAQLIVELDGEEFVYSLDVDQITIGRRSTCDVILDGNSISRHHATILRSGDRYLVRDEGSSNGTLINDEAVQQAEIADGDVISIGDVDMRVELGASDALDVSPAEVTEAFAETEDYIEEAPGPISDEELAEIAGGGAGIATRTARRKSSRSQREAPRERSRPRERESMRAAPVPGQIDRAKAHAIKLVCVAVIGVCLIAIIGMAISLMLRPRGKGGVRYVSSESQKMWFEADGLVREGIRHGDYKRWREADATFRKAAALFEKLDKTYGGRDGFQYIDDRHAFMLARWKGVRDQLFVLRNQEKRSQENRNR